MATMKFSKEHEWIRVEGDVATIGITQHAAEQLGDLVFVELPEPGRELKAGEEICALESVKAVAYVYAPITGTIAAVNESLRKAPELINQDPYGDGWILRIAPSEPEQSVDLLDAAGYRGTLEAAD